MDIHNIFTTLAALCFTLALIVGGAILLRRVNPAFSLPQRNRRLTRTESLSLTPHHTLHLVALDDTEHLIITTPQGSTTLATQRVSPSKSNPKPESGHATNKKLK